MPYMADRGRLKLSVIIGEGVCLPPSSVHGPRSCLNTFFFFALFRNVAGARGLCSDDVGALRVHAARSDLRAGEVYAGANTVSRRGRQVGDETGSVPLVRYRVGGINAISTVWTQEESKRCAIPKFILGGKCEWDTCRRAKRKLQYARRFFSNLHLAGWPQFSCKTHGFARQLLMAVSPVVRIKCFPNILWETQPVLSCQRVKLRVETTGPPKVWTSNRRARPFSS